MFPWLVDKTILYPGRINVNPLGDLGPRGSLRRPTVELLRPEDGPGVAKGRALLGHETGDSASIGGAEGLGSEARVHVSFLVCFDKSILYPGRINVKWPERHSAMPDHGHRGSRRGPCHRPPPRSSSGWCRSGAWRSGAWRELAASESCCFPLDGISHLTMAPN